MSKKEMQLLINNEVRNAINCYELANETIIRTTRLRFCTAKVHETANYFVLQSYSTIVSFIDKRTDTLYDILRLVYGFTSTSARHIAKFEKDYCQDKWNCAMRLTYRSI